MTYFSRDYKLQLGTFLALIKKVALNSLNKRLNRQHKGSVVVIFARLLNGFFRFKQTQDGTRGRLVVGMNIRDRHTCRVKSWGPTEVLAPETHQTGAA